MIINDSILTGKYGNNNGFDVVAYKGALENPSEILIIECKQFKQGKLAEFDGVASVSGYDEASGVVLNAANDATGLPTQMSMDWCFEYVRGKLIKTEIGDKIKLADRLEDSQNIVSRYVFAIDKSDGSGYFIKLSNDFKK